MSPSRLGFRKTLLGVASLVALVSALGFLGSAGASPEAGKLVAEPVLKSAAAGVIRLFGASPAEQPGEVWGSGERGLVRYTSAAGWEKLPVPLDEGGQPLSRFEVAFGALAARTTSGGSVAMLGTATGESGVGQALVVRDPGGQFQVAPEPGPAQLPGELLFAEGSALVAAVEEASGRTGAFVVPPKTETTSQTAVLHFDGSGWSREAICLGAFPACSLPSSNLRVLAIDASGPGNAWVLAQKAVSGDGVELFHREQGVWRLQQLGGGLGALFAKEKPISGVTVAPRPNAQPLTVSAEGV